MPVYDYAVVNTETHLVENIVVWDGEAEWAPPDGYIAVLNAGAAIGWTYLDGVFSAPPPVPPTDAEITASNVALLASESALAVAQKTALSNRISTLQDAVDLQMATAEETAELPQRQAQLTEWKKYAVYLGRVPQQSGWPLTVEWPDKPDAGIDL